MVVASACWWQLECSIKWWC